MYVYQAVYARARKDRTWETCGEVFVEVLALTSMSGLVTSLAKFGI